MTRFRITARGTDIELRGYIDGEATLRLTSQSLNGLALVMASPADDDYDPFAIPISEPENPPSPELSRDVMRIQMEDFGVENDGLLERLTQLHYAQALVIRGERGQKEQAQRELLRRELHHFETEQENERLRAALEQEKAEHESTLHTGQAYMRERDELRDDHTESEKGLIDQVNMQADTIERLSEQRCDFDCDTCRED